MARIVKDYSKRNRTPTNIAPPNPAADEARMSGGAGGGGASQSNKEALIAHEKAMHDRSRRSVIPNQKLRMPK